jgi:hypothetical protein
VADTAHYVEELKNAVLRDRSAGKSYGRSASDTNLLAELDFMVTQRRIHSLYHRNVEITRPEERALSEPSPSSFAPLSDELLQELFDNNFEWLNDELFTSKEMLDTQPFDHQDNGDGTGHVRSPDMADTHSFAELDLLMRAVPACSYCRTRHVKCDERFPACDACTKSERACVYYDHVLQIDVERR